MLVKTSGPPTRSKRYSSHIIEVQLEPPPSEMGAMPLALKTSVSFIKSSHVFGSSAPACSNTFLL